MNIEKKLREIGFTPNEAKVFVNLLKNHSSTATEIANSCGISRTLAYQILRSLIDQNICIESRGNVRKFNLVNPEKIVNKIEKQMMEQQTILKELAPELSNLYNHSMKNDDPMEFVSVLYTKTSIVQRIEALESSSQEIIYSFNKPPYAMNIDVMDVNKISEDFRNNQREAINNQVSFKSIYEVEGDSDLFINKLKYFESMGEDIRVIETLPFKLAIFDRMVVALALENQRKNVNRLVALIIENQQFSQSMVEIFNIYWMQALSIKDYLAKIENKSKN
jgi:sugar-specific transcriptional regulator TrmB